MNALEGVGWTLFAVLVFPGLIFTLALALFSEWFLRKVVARMQNRMGPAYVGPFGLLQPLADFLKLFTAKKEVITEHSLSWLAKGFAALGIGALTAATLLLPLSPLRISGSYDFLIFLYLVCIIVPLGFIFLGLSSPNPFSEIGVSRFLSMLIIAEPTWSIAVFIPVFLVTELYGGRPEYSVLATAYGSWRLWTSPIAVPAVVLALVSAIVGVAAKSLIQPFNIPDAEQEIIAGPETELSGPALGFARLLHDVEVAVLTLFIVYLFLGGPYPFSHLSIVGALLVVVKYLLVLFVIASIESVFGRLRIEQGIRALFLYGLIPAIVGAVIASIAVFL